MQPKLGRLCGIGSGLLRRSRDARLEFRWHVRGRNRNGRCFGKIRRRDAVGPRCKIEAPELRDGTLRQRDFLIVQHRDPVAAVLQADQQRIEMFGFGAGKFGLAQQRRDGRVANGADGAPDVGLR